MPAGHESISFGGCRGIIPPDAVEEVYSPIAKERFLVIDVTDLNYSQTVRFYPEIAEKARLIMDTAWVPSDWYWDPAETREEYLKKVHRAVQTEQVLPVYRPNGLKKLPWEQ